MAFLGPAAPPYSVLEAEARRGPRRRRRAVGRRSCRAGARGGGAGGAAASRTACSAPLA